MLESLQCEGCFNSWQRTVVRGRKPRLCPTCQRWGVQLQPVRRQSRPTARNLVIHDGGKSDAGYTWEKNDCTVRAIALACGVSYTQAYDFMRKAGRKKNKGAYFHMIVAHEMKLHNNILGRTLTAEAVSPSKGIRTAMLRNPKLRKGTWIIHLTRHVAVLQDGVLFDSFDSSRKVVDGAWRVT